MVASNSHLYNREELVESLQLLAPWRYGVHLSETEWKQYIETAKIFQAANAMDIADALDAFVLENNQEDYQGWESESKPFLLMRVMFDLPEKAPVSQRFSFKGWSNWPQPDAQENVNLGWPIIWRNGQPALEANYEGSMGEIYGASAEYHFLLDHFSFRNL